MTMRASVPGFGSKGIQIRFGGGHVQDRGVAMIRISSIQQATTEGNLGHQFCTEKWD